jgi:predicted regulator of amino acid metabolism with ACT domain
MVLEAVILVLGISSVVSYETTGKGLADHAISTVANKDCKIARIVHNEQVCQKEPEGTVTVSSPTPPVASNTIARANDVFAERARKTRETR